jgi:hypothetical protein
MAAVSNSIRMFLEMQRIQLIEGDVWATEKTLTKNCTIPSQLLRKSRT